MNSIGIKEGTTIKDCNPCRCRWVTLLSYPPQYRLEKKCDYCKGIDGEYESKLAERDTLANALLAAGLTRQEIEKDG